LAHRFPMEEVVEDEAIENKGLNGCIHGRSGSERQVLLMDRETLDKFGLVPGDVKENITTRGMDFKTLTVGLILRIGRACSKLRCRAIRVLGWTTFEWVCNGNCAGSAVGCAG
jgi:hypothetical protein